MVYSDKDILKLHNDDAQLLLMLKVYGTGNFTVARIEFL